MQKKNVSLGERLRDVRINASLTQKQVGERLGVTSQAVCKWESGVRSPGMRDILALSEIFGCSSDFLAFGNEFGPSAHADCGVFVIKNPDSGKIMICESERLLAVLSAFGSFCGAELEVIGERKIVDRSFAISFAWQLQDLFSNCVVVVDGKRTDWFYGYAEKDILNQLKTLPIDKKYAIKRRQDVFRPEGVKKEKTFVYFIENCTTRRIKIGITNNIEKRVNGIKTGAGADLNVLGLISMESRDAARKKESELHERFSASRIYSGVSITEWFDERIKPEVMKILEATA